METHEMRKLKLFKETSFGGLGKTVNLWLATLLLGAIFFTGCATSNVIKLSDGFVSHVEWPRCSATSTGVSSAGTNDGGAFG
jgi:hypothetical protein